MAKPTAKETALEIKNMADQLGWEIVSASGILKIRKRITPNDKVSFSRADSEYGSILELLPTTSPGSVWGTTGDGIGALSAMKNGIFEVKKSGGSKRVLNALNKLL